MYNNIIFDLYGTLIDIKTDEYDLKLWEQMKKIFAFYGAEGNAEELKEAFFKDYDRQIEQGKKKFENPEIDIIKALQNTTKVFGGKLSTIEGKHFAQTMRALSMVHISLFDNTIEILKSLKKKNKKIYLLSNAQSCFTNIEFERLGLKKYFDGIFYSSDYKVSKPDKRYFELLFNKFKLKKEESIYIGNDLKSDVKGANNFGIDCIYIRGEVEDADKKATYVVTDGNTKDILNICLK